MVYEVISPEAHGNGTIVGMHTESPACIDSLDTQKAMLDAKSKITFTGTAEEYEAVKAKLNPKESDYPETESDHKEVRCDDSVSECIRRIYALRYQ